MRKHLILLNCTHEIVKIVNSVSGVFYHNEEKGGGWGRRAKITVVKIALVSELDHHR